MSFGNMNTTIYIYEILNAVDDEGFSIQQEKLVASVRAYREGRHGSQRWANLAAFSNVTDLFRLRVIPGVKITTDHILLCGNERLDIFSVENVKGKGMYLEVLATNTKSTKGA